MGHAYQVMIEARRLRLRLRLRLRMDALSDPNREVLPGTQGVDELVPPWNLREILFDTSSEASGRLRLLGLTIAALAEIEESRGHVEAAIRLERDALRYKYLAGYVPGIAAGYHNLGRYAHVHTRQPALALAYHLAAALISALTDTEPTSDPLRGAGTDLRVFGPATVPPRNVADLHGRLADIPGTDLPGLIARLSPDPETAEQTLRDLIAQAQALAADSGQSDGNG
jgi:hypothetical protein